jgi:hypothetical protein
MDTAVCGGQDLPRLDLQALARIVRDLVSGSDAWRHDGHWLEEQATWAGLGRHERGALAALRDGLRRGDRSLFETIPVHWA